MTVSKYEMYAKCLLFLSCEQRICVCCVCDYKYVCFCFVVVFACIPLSLLNHRKNSVRVVKESWAAWIGLRGEESCPPDGLL